MAMQVWCFFLSPCLYLCCGSHLETHHMCAECLTPLAIVSHGGKVKSSVQEKVSSEG